MKSAKGFVLGALACILALFELPSFNGKYLLVELADTNQVVGATRTTTPAPPGSNAEGPRGLIGQGKAVNNCNKFTFHCPNKQVAK